MNMDFDRDFEMFVQTDSKSAISEIYNIIPSLTPYQQQILGCSKFYCDKYQLPELEKFVIDYGKMIAKNKTMDAIRSFNFKNLLKAYSMEEYMRGIKVSTQNVRSDNS